MKIWNLPIAEFMPFAEIVEDRPVVLLTSGPAWTAVSHNLQHLNIIHQAEVAEATFTHWDNLQSPVSNPPLSSTLLAAASSPTLPNTSPSNSTSPSSVCPPLFP